MEDVTAMLFDGPDFATMTTAMRITAQHVFSSLPAPPVATAAPLPAAAAPDPDGVDHFDRLPADVLRSVVSRLPARDATRTTALSRRWRRVWHTVPLALLDAHLLPPAASGRALAASVSRAIAAHPGPFRCIYLTGVPMAEHRANVARWVHLLVTRDTKELVFVNRATTVDAYPHLPAALFACASLTRLYLGFCTLPAAATLPASATFPNLLELGLCSLAMGDQDLAFLLLKRPVLEKLVIVRTPSPLSIAVRSSSLKCLEVCSSFVSEIAVLHAPCMERLLLWEAWGVGLADMRSRIKIDHAPKLRCLGFLVPGMHELEIGNTIIKVGTEAGPNTTLSSVRMLAIRLKLEACNEATMLPSFLRCFPNVETLYVQSENDDGEPLLGPQCRRTSTGDLDSKFWETVGATECVDQHIKKVVFRGFQGSMSELNFLTFIAKRAKALENMIIVTSQEQEDPDLVVAQLTSLMGDATWVAPDCRVIALRSPFEYEGTQWCYHRAFDLTVKDPFDVSKCVEGNYLSECAWHGFRLMPMCSSFRFVRFQLACFSVL